MSKQARLIVLLAVAGACLLGGGFVHAADQKPQQQQIDQKQEGDQKKEAARESATDDLIPLNKQKTVLIDLAGKRVLLKSKVVLREGALEMLLCKKQTKEHESILSLDADALAVHAGLLSLGAKHGTPAQFLEEFQPPKGQRIDIFLQWTDAGGRLHRVPAQRWVRYMTRKFHVALLKRLPSDVQIPQDDNLQFDEKFHELSWYGRMSKRHRERLLAFSQDKAFRRSIRRIYRQSQPREMAAHWVFAGSRFNVNEKTGERAYAAEFGDVICVANFPTAMLDVSAESSKSGGSLVFEPWTERIPPIDTEVTVELVPVFEKKTPPKKTDAPKGK